MDNQAVKDKYNKKYSIKDRKHQIKSFKFF